MKKFFKIVFILIAIVYSPRAFAHEFLNAFLHINVGISYGFPTGTLIDYERRANSVDSMDHTYRPSHYDFSYNFGIDFMPIPALILGNEAHAIKFGVRGRYNANFIRQSLSVDISSSKTEDFGGELIHYTSWLVGPVIYYAPIIRASDLTENYTAGGGFTAYVLFGRIIDGKINAYPSNRDMGLVVAEPSSSKITGYRIDAGLGGVISICSTNVGLNLYYSMLSFTMKNNAYQDNLSSHQKIHEFCVEVYLGIPLEWSRFPLPF